ncbi:hypothetical protein [Aliiroseovarius subalbicans]|uniref:hypothetical protein n=1 Tax=Aliiroseovarius subalbicans TaxID=2925840 RepID=UPI001F58296C|nr:hypothetical protein [Aliiroseovarius subalbicans]MCI2398629.1 hypothetical protein [Aliiroseovarius subalbicans]
MRIILTILLIALGFLAETRPEQGAAAAPAPYEARIIPAFLSLGAPSDCPRVWDI